MKRVQEQFGKDIPIIADSAQPSRIMQFYKQGFRIQPATKIKGSIKSGIDNLKSKKIHIAQHCINTINQIQGYAWKKDKISNTYLDQPIQYNNHCMDALRYATTQYFMFLNKPKGRIVPA